MNTTREPLEDSPSMFQGFESLHPIKAEQSHHELPFDVKWRVEEILVPSHLKSLKYAYFEDEEPLQKLVRKSFTKLWMVHISVFDTSANIESPEEDEQALKIDIWMTDVDDARDDPSWGIRRIRKFLEAGKPVLIFSGKDTNKSRIDAEFLQDYEGQYIFMEKPIELSKVIPALETLAAWRETSKN
jgi:hypothetical protein